MRGWIPDVYAWKQTPFIFRLFRYTFTYSDVLYFITGLGMMWYGAIRLTKITTLNHKAREEESDKPDKLVTYGYYEHVRHPMYGTFVILYAAIAFSIHSAISLVIIVLFGVGQYVNAYCEEKRELLPLFGDVYESYKLRVRNWIFTKAQIVFLTILSLVTLVGFFPLK